MVEQKIVRNYADCLFSVVASRAEHQENLEHLSFFNELLTTSKELRFILCSPIISRTNKLKIVEECLKKLNINGVIKQFFRVIVKNARFEILPFIVKRYRYLFDSSKGVKLVTLESVAVKPNKELIAIIKKYLEDKLKKVVEFNTIQNKSLIGGVVIKYDSFLCDCSIAGTLDKMSKIARDTRI